MPSKRTRWAAHMAAWQSSGLSQSAYCRRHALSLASFGYWRRQLRTDRDGAGCAVPVTRALVPIRVAPASMTPVSSSMMEVCLGNGLRVRLAGVPDPLAVAALVRALSSC
ncbi:IS66 family insertion sequence element accessory protein TnpA [Pseudofulvimonas gallinarii]|uniref:IS66 family insertion sequence element accessory protein TnpA n=1 Tax=Pseudofulvimonas gallinarii TaxID=634155 RepID=UPI0035E767E7